MVNSFLNSANSANVLDYSFNSDKIESIKEVIKESNSKEEIKFFELIKIQKDLRDKTKKYNELKSLLSEIKHLEEMAELQGENHKIFVQQYEDKLNDFDKEIHKELIQKLNELAKENIPAKDIINQIKDLIPNDIPETILEDYISKVLIRQVKI